jgi:hypothetical protein
MSAILIKADLKSSKVLAELAKILGADVLSLKDEQFEDLAFGKMMDEAKTGENVERELIMHSLVY